MKVGDKIPNITFHTRVDGDWKDATSKRSLYFLFKKRRKAFWKNHCSNSE